MNLILNRFFDEKPSFAEDKIKILTAWEHFPIFQKCLDELRLDALYHSKLHGQGHIERVLLLSALNACELDLSAEDSRLCFYAASYHDIGRIDDSKDDDHGRRSAQKVTEILSLREEEMAMVQAAIHVHSIDDRNFNHILTKYGVMDRNRGLLIMKMLKDADNLDRVRVADLDPAFLRLETSPSLISFAKDLYHYYTITQEP